MSTLAQAYAQRRGDVVARVVSSTEGRPYVSLVVSVATATQASIGSGEPVRLQKRRIQSAQTALADAVVGAAAYFGSALPPPRSPVIFRQPSKATSKAVSNQGSLAG